MRKEGEHVEAVYTENGHVVEAGSKEDLEDKHTRIEKYEDLQGNTMFPGFVDSHLHMVALGETMLRLDLSSATSAQEMKEMLRREAASLTPGQWLVGEGWNENNFSDQRILMKEELDDIAPENPVFLTRICRHAALANSVSLRMAGIDRNTRDPDGGVIVRKPSGEETGYLLDQACDMVKKVQPQVSSNELRAALKKAVQLMLKKGLTGGHTEDLNYYESFRQTFSVFQDVLKEEEIKFRANLLVHHEVLEDMLELGFTYGDVNENISFGAMKIFADGALGGRTALLREPYCDMRHTSGVAIQTREELFALVKKARDAQMPVAIHAIGDLALEYAIEALELHPSEGKRDRIIHAQITPPDLIERLARLPVVLDLQPGFVLSDFPWVNERLGNTRLQTSFAWKTLLHSEVSCAGSSDAPIEPVDPLIGIDAAVNRKHPSDQHRGYLPEQKLTPFEAVSLYTTGSAKAIGKENVFGKISPGFKADFTILDKDLLTIAPEDIHSVRVTGTVVNAEFQFKSEE